MMSTELKVLGKLPGEEPLWLDLDPDVGDLAAATVTIVLERQGENGDCLGDRKRVRHQCVCSHLGLLSSAVVVPSPSISAGSHTSSFLLRGSQRVCKAVQGVTDVAVGGEGSWLLCVVLSLSQGLLRETDDLPDRILEDRQS